MTRQEKIYIIKPVVLLWLVFCLVFMISNTVHASSPQIYIKIPQSSIVGQEFPVAVFIDSDTPLNAYSFELAYPPTVLPTTFDWRDSIIDLKQDQPRMISAGRIFFEGASLSPFSGKEGKIITLNFKALSEGVFKFDFAKAEVFLADGKGTKALLESTGISVKVLNSSSVSSSLQSSGLITPENSLVQEILPDKTPPEIKAISWERDPTDSSQKILGFLVADSGSGVRIVEARTRKYFSWSEWTPIQSPVATPSNAWSLEIRIGDGAGNIAEKTIYDWNAFVAWVVPVLLILAIVIFVFIMWVRRKARNKSIRMRY